MGVVALTGYAVAKALSERWPGGSIPRLSWQAIATDTGYLPDNGPLAYRLL